MPLIAYAAITAIGSAVAANQQKVAANKARDAAQVNIDSLNDKTKQITTQNAIDSQNLFKQLNPGAYALQQAGQTGLTNSLGGANDIFSQLRAQLGQGAHSDLLNAAVSRGQQDLSMGGRLDPDTQNAVTRAALAHAGAIGGGALGLGRDVTARDLGLSSAGLLQQRLQNASQLGGQDLAGQQFNSQNYLNQIQTLGGLNSQNFGQYLAAAGLGNQLAQNSPQIGLSGSSVANATIGNQNANAQYYQNIGNANAGMTSGIASAIGQGIGGYAAQGNSFGSNMYGGGGLSSYTNPQSQYLMQNNPYLTGAQQTGPYIQGSVFNR